MNAHALLTSQGWRGDGHTLHPTSNSVGLSHHLLVSKKLNTLGVGKKQHGTSDMWWMNAFDKSLKGLGVKEEGLGVEAQGEGVLEGLRKGMGMGKWGEGGGLYGCFVRGEGLGGTIGEAENGVGDMTGKRKRKIEDDNGDRMTKKRKRAKGTEESQEERTKEEAAKTASKQTEPTSITPTESDSAVEPSLRKEKTKEKRLERKAAKKALNQKTDTSLTPPESDEMGDHVTTKAKLKEERRERKRQKKILHQIAKKDTLEKEVKEPKKKRRKE